MKKFAAVVLFAVLVIALVYAAAPKTYQVTGPVLTINGDVISVQKDTDKWDLLKTADTTITGTLAVGAKVTIEYKMVATKITVK
jgi:cytochrome c oxidase assembly protein Cox11